MASFACSWHSQAKKSTLVGLWTKPEKMGLGSSSKIAIWVSYSWTKSTIIFRLSMDLWINATNRLTHLCDQKEKDERKLENNKAGYTAFLVACGWAVIVKVTRAFGQEQWAQNTQKRRKSNMGTNRPTDIWTDRWTKRGVKSRGTQLEIKKTINWLVVY